MSNCYIGFYNSPWWLLLLIPAFALALIPYFRLSRKYRKTRNRITSIVLHCIVMTLAISVMAGLFIHYEVPNSKNEIILLVDVSDTAEQAKDSRDDCVDTILDYVANNNFKVGVVTFGLDQKYAVPLTDKVEDVFSDYLDASLPDVSATDIASALNYAKTLFNYPETSKIILITDGKETDQKATDVIRAIEAQGTRVDTVFVPSSYSSADIQVVDLKLPDYHVKVNEECQLSVVVYSNSTFGSATIELFDNGEKAIDASMTVNNVQKGEQTYTLTHTFTSGDLHELTVKIIPGGSDLLQENSEYLTHYYLEVFNKILVLESTAGQSTELEKLLNNLREYNITVLNVYEDKLPATVDELRAYDQVILNNISNADLTDVLENTNLPVDSTTGESVMVENLYSYVNKYGGGMFTIGGSETDGSAHAYNKNDLQHTLLQQMLPVQATDYVPPIGLMVIIDRSGSMGGGRLELARTGAASCLNALAGFGDNNYFGLMTLDSDGYDAVVLDLTPVTRKDEIQQAIDSVDTGGGGTVFTGAIKTAAQRLSLLNAVDKRHIIIVTDGYCTDNEVPTICDTVAGYHKSINLTISIVCISSDTGTGSGSGLVNMQKIVDAGKNEDGTGGGKLYTDPSTKIVQNMREDLFSDTILEINEKQFNPTIKKLMSSIFVGIERGEGSENTKMTTTLGGFYGVKRRESAELLLVGDYDVPIYAQWKFGAGTVGSFMCDLQKSSWSSEFMSDENGIRLIKNIVDNLMPTEDISVRPLTFTLKEENVTNKLSVFASLQKGESITGEIINVETGESVSMGSVSGNPSDSDVFVTTALSSDNNYSRCYFGIKTSGVYRIVARVVGADGKAVEGTETEIYKSFAYSAEYDLTVDNDNDVLKSKLEKLATSGGGKLIENNDDPVEIFDNFTVSLDRVFDPKYLFLILAIILFVTDIAVRKFKFKWPHELIGEYRAKKREKKQ